MALFPQSLDEIDFWDLDMFTRRRSSPGLVAFAAGSAGVVSRPRRQRPLLVRDALRRRPCRPRRSPSLSALRRRDHIEPRVGWNAAASAVDAWHGSAPAHPVAQGCLAQLHASGDLPPGRPASQLADDYLDEVADKQDVDFVTAVAHPIPAAIALSMLGVPQEDWDRLAELEHLTVTDSDPECVEVPHRRYRRDRGHAGFERLLQWHSPMNGGPTRVTT